MRKLYTHVTVTTDKLRDVLEEIHETVASGILEDLRNGDKNARREALQLLKQNNITAAALPETPAADLAKLAGKLNFGELEQKVKVVALKPPIAS